MRTSSRRGPTSAGERHAVGAGCPRPWDQRGQAGQLVRQGTPKARGRPGAGWKCVASLIQILLGRYSAPLGTVALALPRPRQRSKMLVCKEKAPDARSGEPHTRPQ